MRSCCEIQLQVLCPQVTMRTESEEREVVDGGAHVPPQAEEARKPDPCTEVSLMVIDHSCHGDDDLVAILVTMMEMPTRPLC